jgi:hypothetical protein
MKLEPALNAFVSWVSNIAAVILHWLMLVLCTGLRKMKRLRDAGMQWLKQQILDWLDINTAPGIVTVSVRSTSTTVIQDVPTRISQGRSTVPPIPTIYL